AVDGPVGPAGGPGRGRAEAAEAARPGPGRARSDPADLPGPARGGRGSGTNLPFPGRDRERRAGGRARGLVPSNVVRLGRRVQYGDEPGDVCGPDRIDRLVL